MSTFDVSKNKAICVLPWVGEYIHPTGKKAPCCYSKPYDNIQSQDTVKDMMLRGQKPSICDVCYKNEDTIDWSFRILETTNWVSKFKEPAIHDKSVQYLDFRYDSTCNLKCKICGPTCSTLWQKEKGLIQIKNKDTAKYFDQVDKAKLKKVYLSGGEPTYIPAVLVFLQDLYRVNKTCEITINTNLKTLSKEWKSVIAQFPNITVECSCDALGTLGSYVRYPLGWQEFEQNVKWIAKNVKHLMFILVASNLTTHKIYDTCKWMTQFTNDIVISVLETPLVFTTQSVPESTRQVYITQIEQLKTLDVDPHGGQFASAVDDLLKKYKDTSGYSKQMHKELLNEIVEQDSHRHIKLREVDRWLYDWIYSIGKK